MWAPGTMIVAYTSWRCPQCAWRTARRQGQHLLQTHQVLAHGRQQPTITGLWVAVCRAGEAVAEWPG